MAAGTGAAVAAAVAAGTTAGMLSRGQIDPDRALVAGIVLIVVLVAPLVVLAVWEWLDGRKR